MSEEKKPNLRQLSLDERRLRLEEGLSLKRAEREHRDKESKRQRALERIAPLLLAIRERTNQEARVLDDDADIIAWIVKSFPFPPIGSTCDWTQVSSSKTIPAPDPETTVHALEELFRHVGAQEDHEVFVLWHDASLPALLMPLSLCRSILPVLLAIPGQEMHLASPMGRWYIEFDPFFDEVNGGKAQDEAPTV